MYDAALLLVSLTTLAYATATQGHPVPTTAAVGSQVVFTDATVPVTTVDITFCTGGPVHTVTVNETLDLLANDTITLPPGEICGIELFTSGALLVSGEHASDSTATFDLELDVTAVDFDLASSIVVAADGSSGGSWLQFASSGWVSASALGLAASSHVVVDDDHTLHDTLVDEVETGSSAW